MSKFKQLTPAYAIATGDHDFEAMQATGNLCMITTEISGLNAADASVELHQSIDSVEWGLVPDSPQTLAVGQTSHQWNLAGVVRGAFLRVSLKKGTATAGIVNKIKMMCDD